MPVKHKAYPVRTFFFTENAKLLTQIMLLRRRFPYSNADIHVNSAGS